MSALLATAVCGVLAVLYRRHSNRHRHLPAKHAPLNEAHYTDRQPQCPTPVKAEPDSRASSAEPRGDSRGPRGALLQASDPREDDADPDIIPCLYGNSAEPRGDSRGPRGALLQASDPREDDADPDIIPCLYERRPVTNGYMSLQRPPSTNKLKTEDARADPEGGAYFNDFRKKDYRIPLTQTSSYHSLGRVNKGVNACSPSSATGVTSSLTAHRLRPEVVTTSHRVQESCI
ncbi:hypothetical protein NE865_12556 [Phthorimaea operculella]|nr:hypothetical protein NE865_12556 [Phthorimaea operculella]